MSGVSGRRAMRPFAWWPTWLLVLFRNLLEWTDAAPMMLIEIYVELGGRAKERRPAVVYEVEEDSIGVWCPAAVGVA